MLETRHAGCLIDRSAYSGCDLDLAVVRFAVEQGFTIGEDDELICERVAGDRSYSSAYESASASDYEALTELANSAVAWINEHACPDGYYVSIDQNSLFMESEAQHDLDFPPC